MHDEERAPVQSLSIAAVKRDTGLSKDTLRVWERRYGFPCPDRDSAGDRVYPPEQVQRLRAIRRLMDAGHRPGRIVALEPQALQALAAAVPQAQPAGMSSLDPALGPDFFLDLIVRHDVQNLRRELGQCVLRLGLVRFITAVMAPLNTAVGEAWMQGRLQVFEEHLYTECVTGVMRHAIGGMASPQGTGVPRVLLTTFSNEPHGLGLLMVEALLALEGCHCLSLGPQTPMADIVQAAAAHDADIVALSFSALLGGKAVMASLAELRGQLPPRRAVWAGGQCPALYQQKMPGVLALHALESLPGQVAQWRLQAIAAKQKI
ncbi:MAG: MerR family transcriptional regulator [Pseudomonadota bacterium]|nr:MerR family transcriptional regulator [Pseudomonadota bacterium]